MPLFGMKKDCQVWDFSFPKKKSSYREVKIHTFPYLIVYKILPKKKTILVSAIHHTSRSPKTKYRK